MKRLVQQIATIAITAVIAWCASAYHYLGSMTATEARELRSNVAIVARAEITSRDEFVLGMAHMAYRNTLLQKTDGADAARSNRIAVIRTLFEMYPDKHWGTMTGIIEEMKRGIQSNPDIFSNISIEQGGGGYVSPGAGSPSPHR